jgi:hypothetical protein
VGVAADLLQLPPTDRYTWLGERSPTDLAGIFTAVRRDLGTPWAIYRDDPVGFVRYGLGEYLTERQQEIGQSVVLHPRTCVPSGHGLGKSHGAARWAAWHGCVWPPGEALVVTTAFTWRQVRQILWQHIGRVIRHHKLPGHETCHQTEWQIDNEIVAFGFAPNRYDEASGQGFHARRLFVIVDEAGGILEKLGKNLDGLMTGDARMLAIGNPPTDEPGSWFERICEVSPNWNKIRVTAFDSPNFTGEECPPEVAAQLVDERWVNEVASEYGTDSSYYKARVEALFPKSSASKVVPMDWIERVIWDGTDADPPRPVGEHSDWQRLGCDIAADGGDEFVIALADGPDVSIVHQASGEDSVDQTRNADVIFDHALAAVAMQERRGYTARRVRVKVDAIGIGAGTADILSRKVKEHGAPIDVVHVVVSERANDAAEYANKRAEMWWNLRSLCRDDAVRLRIDARTKAQLYAPRYKTPAGRITIQPKVEMKREGLPSPDRAEAIGLALYEPEMVTHPTITGVPRPAEPSIRSNVPGRQIGPPSDRLPRLPGRRW